MIASRHFVRTRQRGIALVIGLIMLVLMTMLAISAFQIGLVQTVVIGNAQHKSHGIAAAQAAIDTVINSANFTINPAVAIPSGSSNCDSPAANKLCFSSNGDSVKDIEVTLTPQPFCLSATPIPATELSITSADSPDWPCLSGPQQQAFGVAGAASGNSLCAMSTWEVTAKADDTATGSSVTVTQGVGQRILTARMSTYCP